MQYEVEMKFPMASTAAVESVRQRMLALGAQPADPIEQRDVYFAHPVRDFEQTDEAFRLRSVGARNLLTYKGPKLDAQTKTRREIEIEMASGSSGVEQITEMLTLLGFRPVREVAKTRRPFHWLWQSRAFELALDAVHGLGDFLEIETLSDEHSREAAREAVLSLARELALEVPERRSYLEMLLEQDAAKIT